MARKNGRGEFEDSPIDALLNDRELDLAIRIFLFLLESRRGSDVSLRELLDVFERSIIARVLFEFNGHQVRAARFLNVKPTTLHEKIKKYGILAEIKNSIPIRTFIPIGYGSETSYSANPAGRQSYSQDYRGRPPRKSSIGSGRKAS